MGNAQKRVNKQKNNDVIKKKKVEDSRGFSVFLITLAAVLAVAIVAGTVIAVVSGCNKKNAAPGDLVAIESENYKVTNGMLSYFFYNYYYNQISSNYYSYVSSGLDITKSLKNQTYQSSSDSSNTWFDLFISNAVNEVSTYLVFAEKGLEVGLTLDESDNKKIEAALTELSDKAADTGIEESEYIEYMYGEGVTADDIREAQELYVFAMKQYNADKDSFTFSDEQCEQAYNDDPTPYYYVDYRSYTFTDSEDDPGKAEGYANELAKAADEDAFIEGVYNYLAEKNATAEEPSDEETLREQAKATLTENSAYSTSTDFGTWAFSDERKAGDTTVIENSSGGYTVYFLVTTQHRLEYTTKNARHILIATADDVDTAAKADEVYALWEKTSKKEDDFIALADEYNDDSTSLYENILKGQMVTAFNDWIYDEARNPGDVGIVESTYGHHVIYFIGDGDAAWIAQVKSTLTNEAFQSLIEEYQDKYTVSFDTENLYKLSGKTAYSKTSPVTTSDEAEDTSGAAAAPDTEAAVVADTEPAVIVPADTGE